MPVQFYCIKKPQLFVGAVFESVGFGKLYDAA
jgi:hypothetical protein